MLKALLVCGSLVLVACSHSSSLRARSAGDMHCPADSLLIHRVDDRTYRVDGCEQEVVYVSTCEGQGLDKNCTWVVNSTLHDMQPSTAPAQSGCSFDAQCKGDRICVDKACVAPAPAAAP